MHFPEEQNGRFITFAFLNFTMPVIFHFQDIHFALKNRTALKRYLDTLFTKEGFQLEHLEYIFCTDNYLLKINQEFLHHDTFTDILTFDFSDSGETISGEIYISAERVMENAEKFGSSFDNELHRVIFHGALHLCGYEDKRPDDKKLMRKKEDENLKIYFRHL